MTLYLINFILHDFNCCILDLIPVIKTSF